MSLSFQDLNAFTTAHIVPKSTEVVFKNDPLLAKILANKNIFPGGLTIQRPLVFGELAADAFTKGDTFDIGYRVTDTAFSVVPKYYYTNVTLLGTDDVLNRGPEAAFSIVETKMMNASLTMAKTLALNIYRDGQGSASSTRHVDGLMAWVDDGSSNATYSGGTTYAKSFSTAGGITRSDILTPVSTGSESTYATVGGLNAYTNRDVSTFTLNDLNRAYGYAWFGNDAPDLLVTTQGAFNRIWSATTPLQRYMEKDSTLAKIGFQTFRFNGAEVVISKYFQDALTGYGAGTTLGGILGLNTKYIEFYVSENKKFNFGFTGFKEAQNTLDVAGQFLFAGNMIYASPRTGFKMVGTGLVN